MNGYIVWIFLSLQQSANQTDVELAESRIDIAVRLNLASKEGEKNYFERLVNINIDNLSAYYRLVSLQADKSFWASIFAACIGFVFILISVAIGSWSSNQAPTAIAAVAGIVTESISGLFFYLYNKTVLQLKGYHDSLLAVQNVLLSLKLVSDTTDNEAKKEMTAKMAAYLLEGVQFPPIKQGLDGGERPKT